MCKFNETPLNSSRLPVCIIIIQLSIHLELDIVWYLCRKVYIIQRYIYSVSTCEHIKEKLKSNVKNVLDGRTGIFGDDYRVATFSLS